jgi:hypothetical protein
MTITSLTATPSPFCYLKLFKQRLIAVTSLWLSKSLDSRSFLFKHTNNFSSAFQNRLDRWIYEIKFPKHVCFLVTFWLFLRLSKPWSFRDCSHVVTIPVSW